MLSMLRSAHLVRALRPCLRLVGEPLHTSLAAALRISTCGPLTHTRKVEQSRAFTSTSSSTPDQLSEPKRSGKRSFARRVLRWATLLATASATSYLAYDYYRAPNKTAYLRRRRIQLQGIQRFLTAISIGVQITIDYKWHLFWLKENTPQYEKEMLACHTRGAERLVDLAKRNGGLYIKLGQGFASMNHILPEQYTTGLSVLNDQIFRGTKDEVEQIFKEDFGAPLTELFDRFDAQPIAAASLAQVFRARTKARQTASGAILPGRDVAVKVQYIDMLDRFEGDMLTVGFLMDTAAALFHGFDFGWAVRDARGELEKELDFINEARNGEQCAADLRHLRFVAVPKIDWHLTSRRVLTAEWIDGCKITDSEGLRRHGISLQEAGRMMVLTFARQIFSTGFVHADPHPGNLLFRRHNGRAQLVLIDHGLYLSISDAVRHNFCNVWRAAVLKEDEALQKSSAALGVVEWKLLASLLFQRPYDTAGVGFGSAVTQADLEYMQKASRERMDEVVAVLKRLPRVLTLLLRNVNLTRSLNQALGNPVNRLTIMGREAVRGMHHWNGKGMTSSVYREEMPEPEDPSSTLPRGPWGKLHAAWRGFVFDLYLQRYAWSTRLARWYLRLLQLMGRAPKDLGILEQFVQE